MNIIEVRDGQLPEGVSGKDLTGPIVLMVDGELPEGVSKQHLRDIGATIFSVKSGEALPVIITESTKQRVISLGVSEESLNERGFLVVDDAVIAAGKIRALARPDRSRDAAERVGIRRLVRSAFEPVARPIVPCPVVVRRAIALRAYCFAAASRIAISTRCFKFTSGFANASCTSAGTNS